MASVPLAKNLQVEMPFRLITLHNTFINQWRSNVPNRIFRESLSIFHMRTYSTIYTHVRWQGVVSSFWLACSRVGGFEGWHAPRIYDKTSLLND